MPAALAASVYAAAFSPAAVLFATVVSRRPERVVVMFLSAFAWLVAISLTAAVWVAVPPLRGSTVWLLLHATLLQEASRFATYVAFVRLLRWLQVAGLLPTDTGPISAQLPGAAIANGVGIWIVHTLVLYGDVLWRSARPGSLYTPACSSLSAFGVDAICACGVGLNNVLLSLIGWTSAYPRRSPAIAAGMLALHALACASTALNDATGLPAEGCSVALPSLCASVALTACAAACCCGPPPQCADDRAMDGHKEGPGGAERGVGGVPRRRRNRSRMASEL